MKLEFDESNLPINDDNKHLHQFCDRLDFVLKFGLRGKIDYLYIQTLHVQYLFWLPSFSIKGMTGDLCVSVCVQKTEKRLVTEWKTGFLIVK